MTRDAGRQTLLYRSSLEQHEFRAANRPCVGHHQKYEFFRLLQRCYRVDGAFLAKCSGAGPSPRPFAYPITPASGARGRQYHRCAGAAAASAFAPHRGLRTASVMRNEHFGKHTPRPVLCPSCAKTMRLARTISRFGNLPDLYIFECRACGVSHIETAYIEAA